MARRRASRAKPSIRGIVKRLGDHARATRRAEDLDLELGSRQPVGRLDVGEGEAVPDRVAIGARRRQPDQSAISLRHFWLQEAEAVRMDAALTFYRHVDRGNWVCTTKEYISADWQIAGTHRSERFVDGTCLLRYDNPYVLSPGSIAWARAAP